ncbi:hypothetical protein FRB99_003833 [Tulasnella sp. 403]|nr:hypothetical protein FRB99_003833 [Tulasnella sp. 403]
MSFPKIIYGTAWKKERTTALVIQAVLQGFRAIDTAAQLKHYRRQHGITRADLFLQTKYTSISGQDTSKPLPYDPTASVADQVRASFASSLKNLKTEYLDSYIIHSPLRTPQLTMEAWRVLMDLQNDGKVNMIGVSNCYDVSLLRYIIDQGGRMIDTVQNRWHEGNGWDAEVVDFCKSHGIYYQSFWTLSGSPNLLRSTAIQEISRRTGTTRAQALFKVAQTMGITPLSGSTDEEHMRHGLSTENIDVTEEETEGVKKTMKSLTRMQSKGWR